MKNNNSYRKKKRKNKQKQFAIISFIALSVIAISLVKFIGSYDSTSTVISKSLASSTEEEVEQHEFTICIDAGHGDFDYGAIGITGVNEKDVTLGVALKLGSYLENAGINVIYTRTSDTIENSTATTSGESLYERVDFSNNADADLYISIHCNSYDGYSDVDGVETWYDPTDNNSKMLASLIQDELVSLDYTSDRGILTYETGDELIVIDQTNAVATLIELGFLSNYYDEDYLSSDSGQANCANAIYNAVISYINYDGDYTGYESNGTESDYYYESDSNYDSAPPSEFQFSNNP